MVEVDSCCHEMPLPRYQNPVLCVFSLCCVVAGFVVTCTDCVVTCALRFCMYAVAFRLMVGHVGSLWHVLLISAQQVACADSVDSTVQQVWNLQSLYRQLSSTAGGVVVKHVMLLSNVAQQWACIIIRMPLVPVYFGC